MIKSILTTITAATLTMPCLADSIPALSIITNSDSTVISLKDISKVQYNDTSMIVSKTDGSEEEFVMDSILSMYFSDIDEEDIIPSAINSAQGSEDGSTVLFNLNGLIQSNTDKKGIYIIKSGKETRKVLK